MSRIATVLTHARPEQTSDALTELVAAAQRAGVQLRFSPDEVRKHGLEPSETVLADGADDDDVELCIVLGGDGSILTALRRYAGTTVPVFAVNFGQVGFLATLEPDETAMGFDRAFAGDFEQLRLPAITADIGDGGMQAFNDVSVHRKVGERVAVLAYGVEGAEVGSVRCDGVVVCTPAGSTGYNLANGGPVLAWGVEGYGVSFIAPHSLTARALVVAPDDPLSLSNQSGCPVDVLIDGRPTAELAAGEALRVRFERDAAGLAQVPGSSFYRRLRDKFGLLA